MNPGSFETRHDVYACSHASLLHADCSSAASGIDMIGAQDHDHKFTR